MTNTYHKFFSPWVLLFALALYPGCAGRPVRTQKPGPAPHRPWGMLACRIADVQQSIRVTSVVSNGPADQAGLQRGDSILTVDKRRYANSSQLIAVVRSCLPGTKIVLEVERNGRRLQLTVTVGRFPQDRQLYSMARAATAALDFQRALDLIKKFEATQTQSSLTNKISALKKRLQVQLERGKARAPAP